MPRPLRASCLAALLATALGAAPAATADAATPLARTLARAMRGAGGASGAQVVNATTGTRVFSRRAGVPRILASNTKLFTSSAALARFGVEGTLGTEVLGNGSLVGDGVFEGDIYLRGGGDPTFGTRRFDRRAFGGGPATVEALVAKLKEAGIKRITGRVFGDESRFDSRRGTPPSRWRTSLEVGPLSALSFNRGLASERGFGFQGNPPLFAASRLTRALKSRGVRVGKRPRVGRAPSGSEILASVDSPPMTRLVRIMNKPSDNYFAEMLLKDVGLLARGRGTTRGGARATMAFARRLGARARLSDGSGLSRADRASPRAIVRLLLAMLKRQEYPAFYASLPIAGRDGTLVHRMRRGPARRRCRAKTGTLSNVSALSGYCRARSGETYTFSFVMNRVSPYGARAIQDRMAQAIAGVRQVSAPGAPAAPSRR
jgi:D-alanyl-D-alanine carboxypeptidase/D-alanyl-D-alanine-endopeptidase (penicillin-binding protein 4)